MLHRCLGCAEGARFETGDGQCLPVELAVGGDGQRVEDEDLRGHHVRGQFVGEAVPQCVRVGRGAGRGNDVTDEAFAGTRVGVQDDDGLGHLVGAAQCRLDLAEFDAQATYLHLRVAAADEVEFAGRGAAHEVAGAVHEPTGERVRDEPRGRQSRLRVVAAREPGARQVQLADDAVGHGMQTRVEDDGAGTFDGRADGDAVARGEWRGLGDDDGGLGGTVAVDETADGTELLDEFRRAHVAADHHGFEVGQVVGGDGAERGGRGDDVRDAFAAQQVGQFGAGDDVRRHDHHGGTGGERRDLLEHRGVEARRREPQHPRAGVEPEFGAVVGGEGIEAAVGDDDTLRRAGRAGRVDHVRRRVRTHRGSHRRRRIIVGVDAQPRNMRRSVAESEDGSGVGEQVCDTRCRERGIDGHERRAGLDHGPQGDDGVQAARERQCHHRFRSGTVVDQLVRQTVGGVVEFGVGELSVAVHHRDTVRVRGDTGGQDLGEGFLGQRRRHRVRQCRSVSASDSSAMSPTAAVGSAVLASSNCTHRAARSTAVASSNRSVA